MADDPSVTESQQPRAHNPVELSYATPSPKIATDEVDKLLHVGRRLVFALGAGLFMYGVGNGWAEYSKSDVGAWMGWGAALMALTWPWRRMRHRPDDK